MIKRTIFISRDSYIYTDKKQMHIDFKDEAGGEVSVPIEDIGVLVLESYRLTLSLNVISRLIDNNVAIITCNQKKIPQGLMLNLEGNILQQERFHTQIDASTPLKKQLWAQTIKQKLYNQGKLLYLLDLIEKPHRFMPRNMLQWIESVRSGDSDNYEARGAAFYWRTLFKDYIDNFTRERGGKSPNNLLNYGYAILRAVTARSLTASGLLPTFGIHHHNRYNAYALADDIMEPYRPYVDKIVFDIVKNYDGNKEEIELNRELKAQLLQVPAMDVRIDDEKSPLMIAMQRTTASLNKCYEGLQRKIIYPEMI